jgi:hypothetical protein
MTHYELAFTQDGAPFDVGPQVAGWLAHRAHDGRGRPTLVYGRGQDKGKPLVVPVHASHGDLFAAAGPGKYKLDAVDERGHKVEGVPQAWTGPLSTDDDPTDESSSVEMFGGSSGRGLRYENVICHMLTEQTKMVSAAIGQMSAIASSISELINAAHNANITNRVPPPLPPPSPPPPVVSDDDEDDDMTEAAERDAPTSMLSEAIRLIITETLDRVVPLIFGKLANATSIGGVPVEALADWRKAAQAPEAAQGAPAASSPYVAPSPVSSTPAVPSGPMAAPPQSVTTSPIASVGVATVTMAPPGAAPVVAGAAPSPESGSGAAPAQAASPAASAPQTHAEAAAILNTHMLRVWAGLTPAERAHAGQLIAQLAHADRTAWLAELARLTVPEAIARARAILHAQQPPAAPPTATPQLPSPLPLGEPP